VGSPLSRLEVAAMCMMASCAESYKSSTWLTPRHGARGTLQQPVVFVRKFQDMIDFAMRQGTSNVNFVMENKTRVDPGIAKAKY